MLIVQIQYREAHTFGESAHSLMSRTWARIYRAFGENHFHMFTWGESATCSLVCVCT